MKFASWLSSRKRENKMIFGNPFQIAIWVDVVPEWSSYEVEFGCFARDPSGREASDNNMWVEGMLMLLIDGRYLNGKTMQTTTLNGEWSCFENAVKRMAEEASNTNGRNKTELFNSAHIPRYDIEYFGDDKGDGVEITPMQISDYGWTVYHFVDHEEEVLVYKHTDSEEIHEKRMPLGTTRAVFLEAAEKMKIFDAPPGARVNQS